jgi:hypothetical protein
LALPRSKRQTHKWGTLTLNEGFGGFTLRIERVEFLLESFFGRFPGVDRATKAGRPFCPVEAGNAAVQAGTLGSTIEQILADLKPQAQPPLSPAWSAHGIVSVGAGGGRRHRKAGPPLPGTSSGKDP